MNEIENEETKKRAQQQELDDLYKKIEELEAELAEEDDEETLLMKIRMVQKSNKELEADLQRKKSVSSENVSFSSIYIFSDTIDFINLLIHFL